MRDAVRDAKGRWRCDDDSAQRETSEQWLRSNCTFEPHSPPPPDPRITRLAQLVEELLSGYAAAATGVVPTPEQVQRLDDDVRTALADVEAMSEQERRRRHADARLAAKTAFHRGRRAR